MKFNSFDLMWKTYKFFLGMENIYFVGMLVCILGGSELGNEEGHGCGLNFDLYLCGYIGVCDIC